MALILRIDLFRADTMWLIEKLTRYLDVVEASIDSSRYIDGERISRIEIVSEYDLGDQQEELHLHRLLFERDFPSKLRYSFLVLAFIVFETRSKALCKELDRRQVVVDGRKLDKKGDESFVNTMRRFLETEPHRIVYVKQPVWTELSDFNALRSCIIHGNGDVTNWNQRQRIMQIIQKNKAKGLVLDEDGFVEIEPMYCRHVVQVIKEYFHTVFENAGFGPEETVVMADRS